MSIHRDKEVLVRFGNHIRKLRLERGMTMMELAYATDFEYRQIARVERGETNATVTTLLALAKGLDTTVGEIFNSYDVAKKK